MEISALTAGLVLPAPVLLVEDDPLVQRRLESLLRQFGYHANDLILVASLGEARAALDKARSQPGERPVALALIDLGLPDGSGIDLIRELHAINPALPILVVSAWSTQDSILASLRAGAVGYVLKEREDLEVMMALRSVLRGGAPIDPFVARRIIEELPSASVTLPDDAGLSARESEVLQLVAAGLTNRDIAERLHRSRHTVEAHIKNIYRKLAVTSRTQAALAGRQRGLIE